MGKREKEKKSGGVGGGGGRGYAVGRITLNFCFIHPTVHILTSRRKLTVSTHYFLLNRTLVKHNNVSPISLNIHQHPQPTLYLQHIPISYVWYFYIYFLQFYNLTLILNLYILYDIFSILQALYAICKCFVTLFNLNS
jgi:hypothetical protein